MMRRAFMTAALSATIAAAVGAQEPTGALSAPSGFTVIAARPIRAGELIGDGDIRLDAGATPGALGAREEAVGMEAKVTLYRDRAISAHEIGPPALVERNQIVTMTFTTGALTITAEGRALDRAGKGEKLRVMNLDSRTTVTAVATGSGQVEVR